MLLKLSLVAVVLAASHPHIGPIYSAAAFIASIALLLITRPKPLPSEEKKKTVTKPFARCLIVDFAHEISLAASASPSPSALDSAAAQLLLPSLRNADVVDAVLQRHPRVQNSEGLMCFDTPASQQAWCEMLSDLFQSAGVAVSDAACLRVYLVLKECANHGRVTLAPARSSHLLHDHFLGKNVCVSFAFEERTSIALPLQLILTAMLLHEQRQHHLHPAPALRPLLKFTQKGYGCAQVARCMFASVAAAAHGLVTPASANIFVSSRRTRQCEHSIVARVLVGYFLKVKVRPATRAQWLCCAVLRWRFAVFFLFLRHFFLLSCQRTEADFSVRCFDQIGKCFLIFLAAFLTYATLIC
jgi:hypothetical protein